MLGLVQNEQNEENQFAQILAVNSAITVQTHTVTVTYTNTKKDREKRRVFHRFID